MNAPLLNMLLLPIIIFESGWSLRAMNFGSQFEHILIFAVLGSGLAMIVVASLIMASSSIHGIANWRTALVYASLIAATDPVATLATYSSLKVDPFLNIIVFGESTINDAVAITVFNILNSDAIFEKPPGRVPMPSRGGGGGYPFGEGLFKSSLIASQLRPAVASGMCCLHSSFAGKGWGKLKGHLGKVQGLAAGANALASGGGGMVAEEPPGPEEKAQLAELAKRFGLVVLDDPKFLNQVMRKAEVAEHGARRPRALAAGRPQQAGGAVRAVPAPREEAMAPQVLEKARARDQAVGAALDARTGWGIAREEDQQKAKGAPATGQPYLSLFSPLHAAPRAFERIDERPREKAASLSEGRKRLAFTSQLARSQRRRGGRVFSECPWPGAPWDEHDYATSWREVGKRWARRDRCVFDQTAVSPDGSMADGASTVNEWPA
ncbi:unnamed protein product [Prorocentrum cordatum]|uniref:Cation/H+ exchanger transmembrane domain-containing protein n=1 Tax=Prorocentrum cordatum TaxID=2364126 RepID=A0ABN9ST18_9DINO|nr:unnamed protein product [Polarella glacialis]